MSIVFVTACDFRAKMLAEVMKISKVSMTDGNKFILASSGDFEQDRLKFCGIAPKYLYIDTKCSYELKRYMFGLIRVPDFVEDGHSFNPGRRFCEMNFDSMLMTGKLIGGLA